jgi:hypothetical protein
VVVVCEIFVGSPLVAPGPGQLDRPSREPLLVALFHVGSGRFLAQLAAVVDERSLL